MTGGPGWIARTFPVPAPAWVAPAISLALVVGAAGRAQDYLTRSVPTGVERVGVEVAGFTAWGALFAGVSVLVTIGVVLVLGAHSRWTVLLGHVLGVAVHLSYVLALVPGVPGSGRGVGVVLPPLAAGLVHLVCVGLYVGPRPRRVRS